MSENRRLSSEEIEALPWEGVESSNVKRVAFEPALTVGAENPNMLGFLYVEFHGSGRVYRYESVRREQHAELLEADSVGGYLNAEIKPAHDCERIDVVPGPASPPRSDSHRPVG